MPEQLRLDEELPFSFLLASLLLLFLLFPLLEGSILGVGILDLFVSAALLLAVRALRGPWRVVFIVALSLSVAAIASAAGTHLLHILPLMPAGHVFGLLFFLLTGAALLKRALEPGPVILARHRRKVRHPDLQRLRQIRRRSLPRRAAFAPEAVEAARDRPVSEICEISRVTFLNCRAGLYRLRSVTQRPA